MQKDLSRPPSSSFRTLPPPPRPRPLPAALTPQVTLPRPTRAASIGNLIRTPTCSVTSRAAHQQGPVCDLLPARDPSILAPALLEGRKRWSMGGEEGGEEQEEEDEEEDKEMGVEDEHDEL